jgi:hypothetical protein
MAKEPEKKCESVASPSSSGNSEESSSKPQAAKTRAELTESAQELKATLSGLYEEEQTAQIDLGDLPRPSH